MQPLPEIPVSQYGHGDFCGPASGGILAAGDICGKKVQIISGFHISYEPSVYILPLHASGSGLAIQGTIFLCGQEKGIFYGTDVFRGKAEAVVIEACQKLCLFYGGNFQGRFQPIRETAAYVFIAISDFTEIPGCRGSPQAAFIKPLARASLCL